MITLNYTDLTSPELCTGGAAQTRELLLVRRSDVTVPHTHIHTHTLDPWKEVAQHHLASEVAQSEKA